MTDKLSGYSTTPASNNAASPDGWPEGMTAGSVNNSDREFAARVREFYEDPTWIDFGETIVSSTSSSIKLSTDVTARYTAGRPIRVNQDASQTGYVTASAYSAPDTSITVTGFTVSLPTQVEVGGISSASQLPNNLTFTTTGTINAAAISITGAANIVGTLTAGSMSITAMTVSSLTASVVAGSCIATAAQIASATASKIVGADVLSKLAVIPKAGGQWSSTNIGSGSGTLTAETSYNTDTVSFSNTGGNRTFTIPFTTDMSNQVYNYLLTCYVGATETTPAVVTKAAGSLSVRLDSLANGASVYINLQVFGKRSDE